MQSIGIVDYGLGNLKSVAGALEKISCKPILVSDPAHLNQHHKIILPGVGAFGSGMKNLNDRGFTHALQDWVLQNDVYMLGICLGMQLLASYSTEFGQHEGLNLIKAHVDKLKTGKTGFPVPHVGWNSVKREKDNPLFGGLPESAYFYHVHSYIVQPEDQNITIASCCYGTTFTTALWHNNIFGTQFHPEKSQKQGLKILENFAGL